jgi:hypothetical protein
MISAVDGGAPCAAFFAPPRERGSAGFAVVAPGNYLGCRQQKAVSQKAYFSFE